MTLASSFYEPYNRRVFFGEGRTVVSVPGLRFHTRGLLFLNGAELGGGGVGGGEQEPAGTTDPSLPLSCMGSTRAEWLPAERLARTRKRADADENAH